ncbi:MAG: DNA polymerase III subunit gamma/tau [Saprospiraceae bacterium]
MEGFLVSARKYRPLKWADVIGQEHITQTLKNSLLKNQVAHAFLFCGPRGVGKTTCARILARVLNCENPTNDWEPCNECKTCLSFQENNSFNIFEIDAASNNSVDDIRGLVEQVRYQPQQGKFKIYIIDEVHMLSSQAFNAFLKTLEEPPPYAKFILATTEKHKIIPTILSRCQVYDFRRISVSDIIRQLEIICENEKITAEPEALYLIAQKADGAMRDALSIFDRIRSFSEKTISYTAVLDNLNILDYDYYFRFFDSFLTENTTEAFLLFDKVLSMGFDPEVLLEGLSLHARNLLVCKNPEMANLFEGSEHSKQRYVTQSGNSSQSFIMSCLDLINEADINIARTRNRRLHVEILLAKISKIQRAKNTQFIEAPKDSLEKKTPDIRQSETIVQKPSVEIESTDSKRIDEVSPVSRKVAVKFIPQPKLSSSIPKLASLDSITQKIIKEESDRVENLIELNTENFLIYWNNKLTEQKSKTLQEYMRNAQIEVKELEILVRVGSILGLESIKSELRIEDEMKSIFKGEKITLIVEIDSELSNRDEFSKPKILYSAKQKWDLMIAGNPLLESLQKTLELKLGED